ncbi:SDR family NAD(P)-dependent oxidoreductase [Nocardioides sp.]|uniref:SDR family NAD(P)-dependent oxidoreductase n=1 Tax=Nocardioides sp. TaxID=35761 RepID=UPI0035AF0557
MAIDAARPLALVTGAARGIGAEVARQLAEAGYAVIVSARDESAARAHADELVADGHEATALGLDIGDVDSVAALVDAIGFRPLTVLVNNAAAFADWSETASTADLDRAREVMDTNLFGAWRVVQALLPALVRAGSARVVNVGSGSGSHGDPQFGLSTSPASASYAVSKAALHALTSKLAAELRSTGVLVNAVDPGLTATAPGMEAMGARPVRDGARSVVAAALLPDDGPTGTFTRDGEPLPW